MVSIKVNIVVNIKVRIEVIIKAKTAVIIEVGATKLRVKIWVKANQVNRITRSQSNIIPRNPY